MLHRLTRVDEGPTAIRGTHGCLSRHDAVRLARRLCDGGLPRLAALVRARLRRRRAVQLACRGRRTQLGSRGRGLLRGRERLGRRRAVRLRRRRAQVRAPRDDLPQLLLRGRGEVAGLAAAEGELFAGRLGGLLGEREARAHPRVAQRAQHSIPRLLQLGDARPGHAVEDLLDRGEELEQLRQVLLGEGEERAEGDRQHGGLPLLHRFVEQRHLAEVRHRLLLVENHFLQLRADLLLLLPPPHAPVLGVVRLVASDLNAPSLQKEHLVRLVALTEDILARQGKARHQHGADGHDEPRVLVVEEGDVRHHLLIEEEKHFGPKRWRELLKDLLLHAEVDARVQVVRVVLAEAAVER
mmetsp:Transcript_5764/g.14153  ORF Transcript_5764/g.14153 Transcript_5764/m.14153 type:complete len:354 (-) Transcript_5764:1264-2325(-)